MIENLFVPTVTPFAPDGSVDSTALTRYCEWLLDRGAQGIVLFGTTGEGPSITVDEKVATARLVTSALPGTPIIAAVTEQSVVDAVRCARGYESLALAGLLVLPPGYFREPQTDGMTRFFEQVCAAVGHPVLAYHIPSLAPAVPVELTHELNLWGAKDSSGDLHYTLAVLAAGRSVMVGAERTVPDAVAAGASGAIAGMGNLMPAQLAAVCEEARRGDLATASRNLECVLNLQAELLTAAPGMEWVAAMKHIAGHLSNLDLGDVRTPLVARRTYLTKRLRRAIHDLVPG